MHKTRALNKNTMILVKCQYKYRHLLRYGNLFLLLYQLTMQILWQ